jgi:hypothetical protein
MTPQEIRRYKRSRWTLGKVEIDFLIRKLCIVVDLVLKEERKTDAERLKKIKEKQRLKKKQKKKKQKILKK